MRRATGWDGSKEYHFVALLCADLGSRRELAPCFKTFEMGKNGARIRESPASRKTTGISESLKDYFNADD